MKKISLKLEDIIKPNISSYPEMTVSKLIANGTITRECLKKNNNKKCFNLSMLELIKSMN